MSVGGRPIRVRGSSWLTRLGLSSGGKRKSSTSSSSSTISRRSQRRKTGSSPTKSTESIWLGTARPAYVIGIDPGLATCGLATVEVRWDPLLSASHSLKGQTKRTKGWKSWETTDALSRELYLTVSRYLDDALRLAQQATTLPASVVAVVESPGMVFEQKATLMGHGVIRACLASAGIPWVTLMPSQVRAELGAAHDASKYKVWEATGPFLEGFDRLPNEHERDAAALALAGLRRWWTLYPEHSLELRAQARGNRA